jgi:metal-dependent HD superfamily phosphatase/phosphodiesterase
MSASWQESQQRERVKLVEAQLTHGADTRAQAEVALEWRAVEYRGKAAGVGHGAVDLRLCAQATLDALHQLLGGRMSFRLIGVKSVKAFDDSVAIVALGAHDTDTNENRRLIGTAMAPQGNLSTGVARAVLNATNRVLGNFLATGG